MNNLNDSPNIQPDPRGRGAGAGDGNQWNYALLVHMLGLAAFGLIWNKKSQREIQKVQSQYEKELMEERKQLQQGCEALEEDKQRLVKSLERENDWYHRATVTLKELEDQLMERQNAYCSYIIPRKDRIEMEKNMLIKVVKEPITTELDLESNLKDIFRRDNYCADLLNRDKRKNGRLMWAYLKYWQQQVTVEKHKRAEAAILGKNPQYHTK
ncbi:Coiled-coil domain-containing protein 127 [Larimichthys crocea]|uniref:Coiled-coil domain-containing protein 127 n=1 Tax=Larimichthys crocea TaxID=215358 RepID=A0A6G0IB13_LARCR|nr:Coiled-coil domain-containing protein 127 [Larimichthys crocea]